MKTWEEADGSILQWLPWDGGAQELKHKVPEVTFLGVQHQPDFAELFITLYPKDRILELRALKEYVYQYRDIVISYERFIDVVFGHMMEAFMPDRLRGIVVTKPRGGISSKLAIDSDWAVRGGEEKYRDWVGLDDVW